MTKTKKTEPTKYFTVAETDEGIESHWAGFSPYEMIGILRYEQARIEKEMLKMGETEFAAPQNINRTDIN